MSWEIFGLSEVSKVVDSLHQTPKYSEAGYPMVRVTDVKGYLSLENTIKLIKKFFLNFLKTINLSKGYNYHKGRFLWIIFLCEY